MNAMTGFAHRTDSARVVAQDGAHFTILRHGQDEAALRAFSCLVEPAPGDLVLVGQAEGETFILAVLARRGDAAMRIALPDGATIAAPEGRLSLDAATLALRADATEVTTASMTVSAAHTDASLGRIALLAQTIDTLAQRIVGRFRRSIRIVEESETLRARDIELRASNHMHLRGDAVTMQGSTLVKLDGEQIHLG